jgi:DNA-directed RNA polymerase subunit K/omega
LYHNPPGAEEYSAAENEELADEDVEDDKTDDDVASAEEEEEEEGEVEYEIGDDDGKDEYAAESKACHVKNLNKDFIVLDGDDSNLYAKLEYKKIPTEDRETDPIMTYYEIVRILGTRAQQFNFGAKPLVDGLDGLHPAKMAYIELVSHMTPFIIRRHLPGKTYEEWRVDELEIIHEIDDEFFVPENFNLQVFLEKNKLSNKK